MVFNPSESFMDDFPKKEFTPLINRFVILGPASLQNTLLVRFVEKQLEISCTVWACLSPLPAKFPHAGETLVLVDMHAVPAETIQHYLPRLDENIGAVALLNTDPNLHGEWIVRWPKVKGIFYRDTDEQQLLKGLRAMRNHEYWLPRKILTETLERIRSVQTRLQEECCALTKRENEILMAMGSGASNIEIANQLNLSPHTVKTHIYNMFKKIEVTNRVQAVSWAVSHLDAPSRS
jgi:LuxR family transcriptional regulator of csgAB operon